MTSFGPGWVGKTLSNRYKIEAILGRGGMSSVYRAHDPNLNRKVAIDDVPVTVAMFRPAHGVESVLPPGAERDNQEAGRA